GQGRKLGRQEKQAGLERRVYGLISIHALDVRHVTNDPVEVPHAAQQEPVVGGRVEVDDREVVRPIDGEQVDLATRMAGDIRVDRSQPIFDCVAKLAQDDGEPVVGGGGRPERWYVGP